MQHSVSNRQTDRQTGGCLFLIEAKREVTDYSTSCHLKETSSDTNNLKFNKANLSSCCVYFFTVNICVLKLVFSPLCSFWNFVFQIFHKKKQDDVWHEMRSSITTCWQTRLLPRFTLMILSNNNMIINDNDIKTRKQIFFLIKHLCSILIERPMYSQK